MERADGEKREERELVGVEVERPIAMWSLLSLPLLASLLFRYSPLYSKTTPAFAAGPQGQREPTDRPAWSPWDSSPRIRRIQFVVEPLTLFTLSSRLEKKKRDALQILAPSPLDKALVHRASSPSSSPVWNSGYSAECGRRSRGQGGLPGADNEARPGRDRRPAAIFDVLRVVVVVDGGRAAAAGTGRRRRRRHDLGSPAPRRRRVGPGQRGRCQKSRKRWTSSGSSLASSPRVHLAAALRDRRGGRRRRRLFFLLFVVAVATSSGGLRRRRRRRHPRSPPRRLALLRRPPRRRRRGRPPPGQGPGVEHLPRGARGASGGRRALGGRRRGGRRRRVQPREVRLRDGGRKASSRFRHHHGRFESGEWERSLCLCVCLGGRAEREKKEIF